MKTRITAGFWQDRLEVNAQKAIFHQWEQLVASGCIENFRIAAGEAEGFREGWFFADSDAYKWLDAAARIYASRPEPRLAVQMDDLIALLGRAQQPDGYLFTYNQLHFPGTRWTNLQIEHELYCHGHLIEAGVSHYEATGRSDLLDVVRRAADRIVADFRGRGPKFTPGHEEIEIALLRLYQVTQHKEYFELARQFIEQRGRNRLFFFSIMRQNAKVAERGKYVQRKKEEYLAAHPEFQPFKLPPNNVSVEPRLSKQRRTLSALSGRYFQQHAPIRKQTEPVGHAVRFGYLETAAAMLARETGDRRLLASLERVWNRMVTRRMYVTGGLGSQPGLEGFGPDFDLNPEYAYNETCAALASMFWSWEMAQITREAKYSDLFEWQLYNAASVGIGLDGTTYLYNNPLTCHGGVTRRPWYAVPCCPSNLSRTWAGLGKYIYSQAEGQIWIHQYISGEFGTDLARIALRSSFPCDGTVQIQLEVPGSSSEFGLHLRLPSWSARPQIQVNGHEIETAHELQDFEKTAGGYDPRPSRFLSIHRTWSSGDEISLHFDMPVILRTAHPKVKGHAGKVALTRGPLVYCLESVDNSEGDIFTATLRPPVEERFDPDLLGGTVKLIARSIYTQPLTFIPYFLWGNRGPSQMNVWVNF